MNNVAETIKNLRKYPHAADFFYEELPKYIEKNGIYISVKRAFHELLGYDVGIHAGKYQDRLFGIHIMALTNALRKLREEGKVEMISQGVWIWRENNRAKPKEGKHG